MQLTLSILSYSDQHVSESQPRTFDTFPIIIGRSTSCDYYLEDPKQYVSSNHAVVLVEGDQLFINDTSSNGVYINGVTEPIGRKRTVPLNDQDTLALGAYKLSVAIAHSPSNSAENPYNNQSHQIKSNLQQDSPEVDAAAREFEATEERNQNADKSPALSPGHSKSSEHNAKPIKTSDSRNNSSEKSGLDSAKSPVSDGKESIEQPENIHQNKKQQSDLNAVYPSIHKPGNEQPNPGLVDTPLQAKPQKVSANKQTPALDDSNNHLKILLRAASLNESDFSHLENSVVLDRSGQLLAQLIDAMMELLKSRAEIKKYTRSDNTRLSATGNNPLKFSASSADALEKLLTNNTQGNLQSNEAIQEAVDDLSLHQFAMLEGMKMAVRSLLMKFDPNELAKKMDQNNGNKTNIPVSHKAKMWELFCEQYDEIREEATSDFEALLGAEFNKIYDQKTKNKRRD